jgi:hypothetical protein
MPGVRCHPWFVQKMHGVVATGSPGSNRHSLRDGFTGFLRALVSGKPVRMCERAVLTNRPPLDLSPIVLEGRRACREAWDRPGVFLNPNSCRGLEPEPSKEGSG